MSSQKLKWNHPLLQRKQKDSIDQKIKSQQGYEKFGSKNKSSINQISYKPSCKHLENLKNSLLYSNKCQPILSSQHNVACDIKKVKKGIENTIIARRSSGLYNHLGQVERILHEAKAILKSAHLLLDEMKELMVNLKQTFTFSIQKYLSNKVNGFINSCHIRKIQSINLVQKSDQIQTLTSLTFEINSYQQKNQFQSIKEKLARNQHISSTSMCPVSKQKSNACFNKFNTTVNRKNNILSIKTKRKDLSPQQSKEKSIQRFTTAINVIKSYYDTSNSVNSNQII